MEVSLLISFTERCNLPARPEPRPDGVFVALKTASIRQLLVFDPFLPDRWGSDPNRFYTTFVLPEADENKTSASVQLTQTRHSHSK